MKNFRILSLVTLILMVCQQVRAGETAQMDLQRITLTAGIHKIDTQVAITGEQHAVGLMYRNQMPPNEGMLFVFGQPTKQCFWMKNTFIPLTAAFVADDGTIVNLENMKPQTAEPHCSTKPVRYVLEMNQGWFLKKGVRPGSKLSGRPFNGS